MFFKITALVLVTAVLSLVVGKKEKDISLLLGIAACCLAGVAALSYFEPVLSLITEIEAAANLQNGMFTILLKTVGVSLTSEIAGAICSDAGNTSLSKILQIASSGAVLFLAIPIFQSVWNVLTEIIAQL